MKTDTNRSNPQSLPKYLAAAGIGLLLMTPLTASADHERHDIVEVLAGAAVAYLIIDSLHDDNHYYRRQRDHYADDRHYKRGHYRYDKGRHHDRYYKGRHHAKHNKRHHARYKHQHKHHGYKDGYYRRYYR